MSGAALDTIPIALIALSLFYTAGMFLNDVCDASFDAAARPDRPIPNGDVGWSETLVIAILLLLIGGALLLQQPHPHAALWWALALTAAITAYDLSHKGKWYGPIVMGLCSCAVYGVAASGAVGVVPTPVIVAGVIMWIYVIALTWVAKAANLGYAVPWMLAGICLVDADRQIAAGRSNWRSLPRSASR